MFVIRKNTQSVETCLTNENVCHSSTKEYADTLTSSGSRSMMRQMANAAEYNDREATNQQCKPKNVQGDVTGWTVLMELGGQC